MSNMMDTVRDIVGRILNLGDMINEIHDTSNLEDYGLDSQTSIQLISAIETEFDFEFQDTDLIEDNFKSISTIIKCIEKSR